MLLNPSLSFACFALLFFVLSFLLPFGNPRNIILPTTVTAQSNLFMLTMVLLNLLRLMQPYVHWVPPSLRQRGRLRCCCLTTTSHQSHSLPLASSVQVLSYRFPLCSSFYFLFVSHFAAMLCSLSLHNIHPRFASATCLAQSKSPSHKSTPLRPFSCHLPISIAFPPQKAPTNPRGATDLLEVCRPTVSALQLLV